MKRGGERKRKRERVRERQMEIERGSERVELNFLQVCLEFLHGRKTHYIKEKWKKKPLH